MDDLVITKPMLVRDIVSSPVITVDEDAPIIEVAQLMFEQKIGSIVVTSKEEKPVGIITERDLVTRVLAKNCDPKFFLAKEVMSSPLITINPKVNLTDAADRMSELNIRRLGVMYKGSLVGMISSKDILAIMPELIEIIQEKVNIASEPELDRTTEQNTMAGYCDRCSTWFDNLHEVEGNFLCEECQEHEL